MFFLHQAEQHTFVGQRISLLSDFDSCLKFAEIFEISSLRLGSVDMEFYSALSQSTQSDTRQLSQNIVRLHDN
jgi:hypothetical protein